MIDTKSEAQKAMDRLTTKVLARMSAVSRAKAAIDGEVTEETASRHAAWVATVEAWNLLPYELAAEHRQITQALKAEAKRQREESAA